MTAAERALLRVLARPTPFALTWWLPAAVADLLPLPDGLTAAFC
ncbi:MULTISPECIES: hypothetical protein [unclassified Kitasatospora]